MASRSPTSATWRLRAVRRAATLLLIGLLAGVLAGCSAPGADPSTPATGTTPSAPTTPVPSSPSASASPSAVPTPPSKPPTSPSTQKPTTDQVVIDVTIANGKVNPSGRKVDVPQDATVVLNVTSDIDDEIHAHLGSDDFSLFVQAGRPKSGRFVADAPGSFEVESHELGKIIVILNVR